MPSTSSLRRRPSTRRRLVVADPTLRELLATARTIWGNLRMTLPDITIAATVVVGDLARAARDGTDDNDAARELGNLILSSIRWADDLGLDLDECIRLATLAQIAHVERERRG